MTATDLTPSLVEEGRRRSEAEGLDIAWHVADAEALPFADGEHDVVLSSIGVMFAPHHQAAPTSCCAWSAPAGAWAC